ncbi:putative aspartic peptidase A1 family, beta-secretase BACE1, aspartic peptidase domain superfamily [Plasmopara halstedii]
MKKYQLLWVAAVAITLTCLTAQTSSILQQRLWGLSSGLAYYLEVNIGQPVYSSNSSSANSFNCYWTRDRPTQQSSSSCVDETSGISVAYIRGGWSGSVVRDTFSGQGLGIIERMPFAQITREDGFVSSGYDGIIGMGYESIASPSDNPWTPYFDVIRDYNQLNNIFSLQMLEHCRHWVSAMCRWKVMHIDMENYHQGDIVYTPLVHERYYNVIVTDIGAKGQSWDLIVKR